ncbi:MAG: Nif3-like dinuclear metal center hexameric protein [Bacteroidota bacterium]
MKIKEIINTLERWAPPSYQESYDNSGLLVGDSHNECTGVLVTLDTIEAVIDEAISRDCNLIVSHHPIVFRGLKTITGKNYVERTILKAIKNDIAIYAIHTNLDNVHTGVNSMIAKRLGLQKTKILAPKSQILNKLTTFVPLDAQDKVTTALFEAGAGKIGQYGECSFTTTGTGTFRPGNFSNPTIGEAGGAREKVSEARVEVIFPKHLTGQVLHRLHESHPYEEVAYYLHSLENSHQEVGSGMVGELEKPMKTMDFLQMLKQVMETDCVRYTALCRPSISRVAVCGGAGGFLLNSAKRNSADIFITADYKYHEFFDADGEIIIADIGHYESEAFTKDLIIDHLKENLTNIAFYSSTVNSNPINYL